jgi:Fe-S cluster assembly protein SufB
MRDENQLHAAVVELIALDDAEIKYSTVQNWYPGDKRTARAASTISSPSAATAAATTVQDLLDPGRDRLGDHLEIPVLHPARRQFAWRVLFDRHVQRLSAGRFRHQDDPSGQEHLEPDHLQGHLGWAFGQHLSRPGLGPPQGGKNARNFTQCDSPADRQSVRCAHRALHRGEERRRRSFEHEATTSKISDDQLFYCLARGIPEEEAVALIVNGFVKDVIQQLPMEFMVEAQKLIGISLEGADLVLQMQPSGAISCRSLTRPEVATRLENEIAGRKRS